MYSCQHYGSNQWQSSAGKWYGGCYRRCTVYVYRWIVLRVLRTRPIIRYRATATLRRLTANKAIHCLKWEGRGVTKPTSIFWYIRALSKPPQRQQVPDPRTLWLLVGTSSAFGPELAYRLRVAQSTLMDVRLYFWYTIILLYMFVYHIFITSPLCLVVGPQSLKGELFTNF